VGTLRFADALAFRLYYKFFLAATDRTWEDRTLDRMREAYPSVGDGTPVFRAASPNSAGGEEFIRRCAPNIVLALCKTILKPRVFSIPTHGTFVLHPGICPEYRNAHGCFWALANDDVHKVGMSLLRIDDGIDTGPVYGQFTYPYDERLESHVVIQHRAVMENLDALREKLTAICGGLATPIDTAGRASATWGQPWLTSYVKWKHKARRRRISESTRAAVS
jgi:methionyl-tRNA formyltransferase